MTTLVWMLAALVYLLVIVAIVRVTRLGSGE